MSCKYVKPTVRACRFWQAHLRGGGAQRAQVAGRIAYDPVGHVLMGGRGALRQVVAAAVLGQQQRVYAGCINFVLDLAVVAVGRDRQVSTTGVWADSAKLHSVSTATCRRIVVRRQTRLCRSWSAWMRSMSPSASSAGAGNGQALFHQGLFFHPLRPDTKKPRHGGAFPLLRLRDYFTPNAYLACT
jgi:hypothetical protein